MHCTVESFSLLYLNPPYDWALGSGEGSSSNRTEQVFLSHTYRWLKPGGVLLFVIPGDRLAECSQTLATHFRDVRIYRLEAPECVRYKQVIVLGVRRNRRERERLRRTATSPEHGCSTPAWRGTQAGSPPCPRSLTRNTAYQRAGRSN